MAQPPPYNRQTSFANLQALNPSGQPPGNSMDAEYNAIKTTLDATLVDLALIQNDDGTVKNASIGPAQLSSQLTVGFTSPSVWVTAHMYTASPASTVLNGTGLYICLVSHTSGVFATDLAAGKWLKIFDLSTLTFGTASQIAVSSHGSNVTTNVQTSLNNLDDNKAATSHTHTASQISDSTVAGRGLLTAVNVAAQQSLLGLGALAFLNSAPAVTVIPNQLAYTGSGNSGTLASNQNDFTPTNWATNSILRLTSSTAIFITGLGATTTGDLKFLQNVGTFPITFIGNSSLSNAANRLALGPPLVLGPSQGVTIQYDGATSLWRVLSQINTNPPVGSFRNLRVGNVANYFGDSAPSSPNTQAYINFDELVLEDGTLDTWWVRAGALTVDGAVAGGNGLDTGAFGASTWYSIWAIGNPSTNGIASLMSVSATAPTLPSGYTFKARLGWMRTDGSSHFLKTIQYGRTARYTGTMPLVATGSGTTTPSVANFVPSTATKIALILSGSVGAGTSVVVGATTSSSPAQMTVTNGTGAGPLTAQYGADLLLENSTVSYSSNAAGANLSCYGWEDS